MPVITMEVVEVKEHPNADSLKVYQMQAVGFETVQIIANLETVYERGDRVAVALLETILKDGTKIKATKLRGLPSYGMAMGKVEVEAGTDLSAFYCKPEMAREVRFLPWPSIELLHNLYRDFEESEQFPTIVYRAKIKLDGTNAAVQLFSDGRIACQSRSKLIVPDSDNAGFAAWVEKNIDFWNNLCSEKHVTVFGEWCGKGIQKRTAISQIDRAVFAVFALQYGGVTGEEVIKFEVEPEKIRAAIPPHEDIFILPFCGESIALDFGDRDRLQEAADAIDRWVLEVETVDPWVKETFGIEGLGEGLVFYPETEGVIERLGYSELLFKAKGEKHRTVKVKKAAQIEPENVEGVAEFVELFVTPARLEQGVAEACEGKYDIRKMGDFLQWFANDVKKESNDELERAQLSWKAVGKAVIAAAKSWYQDRL